MVRTLMKFQVIQDQQQFSTGKKHYKHDTMVHPTAENDPRVELNCSSVENDVPCVKALKF